MSKLLATYNLQGEEYVQRESQSTNYVLAGNESEETSGSPPPFVDFKGFLLFFFHLANVGDDSYALNQIFYNACMGTRLDNFRHMESIRNTMLMHEDVFRHQVQELHRLYSVQKILMDELKKEVKKNRFRTTTSTDMNQSQFFNQHQITTQTTSGLDLHVQGDPRARGFDLERPAGEEAATVVVAEDQAGPSSRTNQMMSTEGSDEDSEVELTLSIGIGGSGSSKKKLKNSSTSSQSVHNKEITREPDSSASCSGPGTPVSSSSATFDQEKKLPHWLFQGFSINRT
ncbi:hypothetical protein V6N13_000534 [Hibiscus sabdariffa]